MVVRPSGTNRIADVRWSIWALPGTDITVDCGHILRCRGPRSCSRSLAMMRWTKARLNEFIKGKRGVTAHAALHLIQEGRAAMSELTIWTYDWVPAGPRGFVRDLRFRWA